MERDERLAEIESELQPIRERLAELSAEKSRLETEASRERWPNGPFVLHYYRYGGQYTDEYDEPLEALRSAESMEEYGTASTERVEDSHGKVIYDRRGSLEWRRVDESYPPIPERVFT